MRYLLYLLLVFSLTTTACAPEQKTSTAVVKKPNKPNKAAKAKKGKKAKAKYVKKSSLKATLKENLKISEADASRIVNIRKQLSRTLKAKKQTKAVQRKLTQEANKKIKNILGNKYNKYDNLIDWYKRHQ